MPTVFSESFRNVSSGREGPGGTGSRGYIVVSTGGAASSSPLTGFPIIITDWQVTLREKVQVLESFNEHVHAYAFGKGVGNAVIGGLSLESLGENQGHFLADARIRRLYNDEFRALAAAKSGKLVRISGPGSMVLTGLAQGLTMSLTANPSNTLQFQMQFLVLSSALGVGC